MTVTSVARIIRAGRSLDTVGEVTNAVVADGLDREPDGLPGGRALGVERRRETGENEELRAPGGRRPDLRPAVETDRPPLLVVDGV